MKSKLAIIIDGGGMRCVYSGGVLTALAEFHNLKNPDILIGSSGSTGSLAYYLVEQYAAIKNIWTNLLISKKFISFWRLYKIMDIDFLIDEVFKKQEPLHLEKIYNSHIKFFITTTEYATGKLKYFSNHQSADLFECLRASSALPIIFGKKIKIQNIEYIDGSLSSNLVINIEKATSEGAKNILIIKNEKHEMGMLLKLYLKIYCLFINKKLKTVIQNEIKSDLSKYHANYKDIKIFTLTPSQKLKVGLLDNKKSHLEEGFDLGYTDTKNNQPLKLFLESLN